MSPPNSNLTLVPRVYSRKKIDISYLFLLSAFLSSLISLISSLVRSSSPIPSPSSSSSLHFPSLSSPIIPATSLITLSARSALSALLSALSFPPGSEILLSSITIPSIPALIRAHGLVPIAVDIRPDTTVNPEALAKATTSRTKAVIIAQLFGARWNLTEIAEWTRETGVLLIEDVAQGFDGSEGMMGDTEADVGIWSFGPIKTCSALGGGVVVIPRNGELMRRVREEEGNWEQQGNGEFAGRVAKYAVFKTIAESPVLYGGLMKGMELMGIDPGKAITELGRNVRPGGDLLGKIRRRACEAQAGLVERVIRGFDKEKSEKRRKMVERLVGLLPEDCKPLGWEERKQGSLRGRYWLCPIRVTNPDLVVRKLLEVVGVDAADGGTSLVAVGEDVRVAKAIMREVVYLPIDHFYSHDELVAIAGVFEEYGRLKE